MDNFLEYCKNKGITLLPWQIEFVKKAFETEHFISCKPSRSGKSFILKLLNDYSDDKGAN